MHTHATTFRCIVQATRLIIKGVRFGVNFLSLQKTIIPFLQEAFMPVVQHIFSVLSQPTDELDMQTQIEKDALQRSFFQFLQGLIANDVLEVISNQSKSSHS